MEALFYVYFAAYWRTWKGQCSWKFSLTLLVRFYTIKYVQVILRSSMYKPTSWLFLLYFWKRHSFCCISTRHELYKKSYVPHTNRRSSSNFVPIVTLVTLCINIIHIVHINFKICLSPTALFKSYTWLQVQCHSKEIVLYVNTWRHSVSSGKILTHIIPLLQENICLNQISKW